MFVQVLWQRDRPGCVCSLRSWHLQQPDGSIVRRGLPGVWCRFVQQPRGAVCLPGLRRRHLQRPGGSVKVFTLRYRRLLPHLADWAAADVPGVSGRRVLPRRRDTAAAVSDRVLLSRARPVLPTAVWRRAELLSCVQHDVATAVSRRQHEYSWRIGLCRLSCVHLGRQRCVCFCRWRGHRGRLQPALRRGGGRRRQRPGGRHEQPSRAARDAQRRYAAADVTAVQRVHKLHWQVDGRRFV